MRGLGLIDHSAAHDLKVKPEKCDRAAGDSDPFFSKYKKARYVLHTGVPRILNTGLREALRNTGDEP